MSEVRGVIVSHGSLAQALVEAVGRITGADRDALIPISNEGLGPDGIVRAIDERLGAGPTVVFTDMAAGSCGIAARRACSGPERVVITGANLPLLLDFVMHRDMPLGELAERLVRKGRDGIMSAGGGDHADRAAANR